MGERGPNPRRIEVFPKTEPVPYKQPVKAPAPVPAREPAKVPA